MTALRCSLVQGVSGEVTVDLHDCPLRTALEEILHSTGKSITYRVEGGIYAVAPTSNYGEAPQGFRTFSPDETLTIPYKPQSTLLHLQMNFVQAAEAVRLLRTDLKALVPPDITFAAGNRPLILLTTYGNDDSLRKFKELLRSIDVPPVAIGLQARLVVSFDGPAGHRHAVVTLSGKTHANQRMNLNAFLDGAPTDDSPLGNGQIRVIATPSLLGDGSVQAAVEWSVDVLVRAPGNAKRARVVRKGSGSIRIASGDTAAITRSSATVGAAKGEVAVYLTPRCLGDPRTSPVSLASRMQTLVVDDRLTGDDAYGPVAAQGLAVALAETNSRWEVLRKSEVDKAAETLALKPPFAPWMQDVLCRTLAADVWVSAAIRRPSNRRPILAVQMRDVRTGAVRTASAEIPSGKSPWAIQRANMAVVKQLEAQQPVYGVVLATVPREGRRSAVVSLGTSDGVSPGAELLVLSGDRRIGRVRVLRCSATECEGEIVEGGSAVVPEDVVQTYVWGRLLPVPENTDVRP